MMSHLPEATTRLLTSFAVALDEGLQAQSHKVAKAIAVEPAFDEGYVDSTLTRALVCSIIADAGKTEGVTVVAMRNGGCEIQLVDEGSERLFRVKRAELDVDGRLVVKVSSDSFLTYRARAQSFFDLDSVEDIATTREQWVLAYVINRATRTLHQVSAALPIDLMNESPPYRLRLDPVVHLQLSSPTPPSFTSRDDDLDLGDEFEQDDEASA